MNLLCAVKHICSALIHAHSKLPSEITHQSQVNTKPAPVKCHFQFIKEKQLQNLQLRQTGKAQQEVRKR